jgi:hypothetical protein
MLRIPVDFNTINADEMERVAINAVANNQLLSHFRSGLRVVLYEEGDIEVEANLEFDENFQRWFGIPDWATRRDLYAPSDKDT